MSGQGGRQDDRDYGGRGLSRHQRGWSQTSSPDLMGREHISHEERLLDDDALEEEVNYAVEAFERRMSQSRHGNSKNGSSSSSSSSTSDVDGRNYYRASTNSIRSESFDTADEGTSGARAKSSQTAEQAQGRQHQLRRRSPTSMSQQDGPYFDLLDHFTLRSSLYRYRNNVVLNGMRHQLIFGLAYQNSGNAGSESQGDPNWAAMQQIPQQQQKVLLTVKRASTYGGWIFFLKFLYVYVVLFLVGATVVFCILIPVQYGLGVFLVGIRSANSIEERLATLMTLLAMPHFVESLSIMSTLVIGYLNDIWNDFEFINTMTLVSSTVRDWFILTLILFIPLGTFAVSFLLRDPAPITNALLAALWSSLILFALTTLYTIWIEVYSCLKIMQTCVPRAHTLWRAFYQLIRHRFRTRFAFTYWPGLDPALEGHDLDEETVIKHLTKQELSPVARCFYEQVKPRRLWNVDKVLKPRPILSRQAFSVLFLCCLSRSRFRGSIRRSVVKSSFACVVFSSFLIWLVVIGYLVYSSFIPTIFVVLSGLVSFAIFVTWIGHNLAWMQEFERGSRGVLGVTRTPILAAGLPAPPPKEEHQDQNQHSSVPSQLGQTSNSHGQGARAASVSSRSRNPFVDAGQNSNAEDQGFSGRDEDNDRFHDMETGRGDEEEDAQGNDFVSLESIEDFPGDDDEGDNGNSRNSSSDSDDQSSLHFDIDNYERVKSMRESRFVYAEPKMWVAVILLMISFGIFVAVPMYGFSQLGVGGYAAFFAFACILSLHRFIFNVPSLVETFGTKAFESLELPLFDLVEENQGSAAAEASAATQNISSTFGLDQSSSREGKHHHKHHRSHESANRTNHRQEHGVSVGLNTNSRLMSMTSPMRQATSAKVSNGGRRVHLVLTRMAQQQMRTFWIGCFALAVIFMIILVGFSVDQDTTLSDYEGVPLLGNATHKTHYVPTPTRGKVGFMYPVCTLFDTLYAGKDDSGLTFDGNLENINNFAPLQEAKLTTMDFIFLSDLAYSHAQTSQMQLDRWFGPDVVHYIPPEQYDRYAAPRLSSAVFKLLHIPSQPNGSKTGDREVFLVAIRGTINTYDLLSDMQIWFPAMLFQWLRYVLPFGAVWNAVIPSLIRYMNVLETAPSSKLSYQADLTNFVRSLRNKNPDAFIAITGHSLGGGIAMLVGAAESIPAIGISGPNSLLSREKFGLDQTKLDSFAVNIIPRGDPIPNVDDHALLTESILCRADRGSYLGACHELKRTFCELQYICGSGDRPPIAICNTTYEFPAPLHIN